MKVIITAGGTGGHIYPAIAIINKIKEKEPNSEFIYIGTHDRMEKDIIPELNIKYIPLEIYGLSKKDFIRNINNIYLIKKAYIKSKNIIKEFKPDIVIGVGGYVTYPVILAAHKLKIKTFIHEQNSIPGKSNKMLSRFADKIGISFKDSEKYFDKNKVVFTGNPCSENVFNLKTINKSEFGIKKDRKVVLFVSGSLGSNSINTKMIEFLKTCSNKEYDVIYITGKKYYDEFSKNIFSKNIHLVPFIDNLGGLLKSIDVIVSRAGATSLSEILALEIPSIIIPSPFVANNHQYYNALSLNNHNACIMIEEKDINVNILDESITKCLDKEYSSLLINNMKKLSINDSSTRIYNTIKELIK